MTSRLKAGFRLARVAALVSVVLLAVRCSDEPTGPQRRAPGPSLVVRAYPGGCVPEVITSSSSSADTVFTTFETADTNCYPDLVQWGIDMADPIGTDTPQGNGTFSIRSNWYATNLPSGTHGALGANYTPPQVMIEFDPPVKSVQFYYSRLSQSRAMWNGQIVNADSMPVWARSRIPGTTFYQDYDYKVLRSNVPSTTPPWSVWDSVKLQASGNYIQWCWFDGTLMIDNLKITRDKPPPPCPTPDDTVLSDRTVQHQLNQQWAQSALELKERGGWIYRNLTTGEYLVQHDASTDATRTRCSVNFSPIPQPPPGYEGVRIWHTHIVPPGMPRQFLIGDCPNLPPRFISGAGPGREDRWAKTEAAQKPHIVIDNTHLWIQYPMAAGGGTLKSDWINDCRAI